MPSSLRLQSCSLPRRVVHARSLPCVAASFSSRQSSCFDVLVLGDGAHAAAVARELSAAGQRVLCCSGSSHAPPPLRPLFSTGECGLSTELCSAAAPLWRELQQSAQGAQLLVCCGALDLGPSGSFEALDAAARSWGVRLERLAGGAALAARWRPLTGVPRGWEGRLDAQGGALLCAQAAAVLRARAARLGATSWEAAALLELQDKGDSFRLLLGAPGAGAAEQREAQCEHLVVATEDARQARALLAALHSDLLLPVRQHPTCQPSTRAC